MEDLHKIEAAAQKGRELGDTEGLKAEISPWLTLGSSVGVSYLQLYSGFSSLSSQFGSREGGSVWTRYPPPGQGKAKPLDLSPKD